MPPARSNAAAARTKSGVRKSPARSNTTGGSADTAAKAANKSRAAGATDDAARPAAYPPMHGTDGRARVAIEAVTPTVPGGDYHVKRAVGEVVRAEADIFTDGHDMISAVLRHRRTDTLPGAKTNEWSEVIMTPLVNDRWHADFPVHTEGEHEFVVEAWVDHFKTWQRDLRRRAEANQNLEPEYLIGAQLIEAALAECDSPPPELEDFLTRLRRAGDPDRIDAALDDRLTRLMLEVDPRRYAASSRPTRIWADRIRARFSSWYELFPRSAGSDGQRHGTFRDVINRLDDIAAMGFDVLYLPPIHPIGRTFRKGKNNTLTPTNDDVGSPWAIGGPEGGHDSIHPQLGGVDDFKALVRSANSRGIEIALDLALQCSPDHPYVKEHPEWFKHRPDGTIQYAENPPKKYQDIYPFDFECENWKALWEEVLRVVLLWVDRGVRIFRVDNPHTKPFALWEWLISQVKQHDPGVLFLAEAFTRPKVMHRLAKIGFTQSYTYFAWRNSAWELRQYLTELTTAPSVDYFRPNAWPNTPDILTEQLQHGGRGTFIVRAALAGTLCASWGMYGPTYELMEHTAAKPGSEEYLDSEKYQIRSWDTGRPDSLAPLIAAINRARKTNPALQQNRTLRFHECDNPNILCYSKTSGDNIILVAANVDPHNTQWGRIRLDLEALGLSDDHPYELRDLLTQQRYTWRGRDNVVGLDPSTCPVHIFGVRRHERTEKEFEPHA